MQIDRVGLILEGGAMRGVYTSGVLDFFMDRDLYFQYIIGVSAGACQSFSYVSRQRGRNFKVSSDYVNDKRYLSIENLIRDKSIFGMDFMFDEIPRNLVPLDYDTFNNTKQKVLMGTTNCRTGKVSYFANTDGHDMFHICRASSSMPLLAPMVQIQGEPYLDGGIADPIPIKKAIADGNEKNVVILTRNANYRKVPSKRTMEIMSRVYRDYPALLNTYSKRHTVYNKTLEYLSKLEKQGKVFIIRPTRPVHIKRTEKDIKKLTRFYNEGIEDAMNQYSGLQDFLGI